MADYSNWLLVGGTGRNIGKTTAAERFIYNLSKQVPVVGVKISNAHPGDLHFHGQHQADNEKPFEIMEETDRIGGKDSMRFLKAGAKRSFFVASKDEFLSDVLDQLTKRISSEYFVVCESNGLRHLMDPGLFIMVQGPLSENPKKNLEYLLHHADYVLPALNSEALELLAEKIRVSNGKLIVG